MNMRTVALWAAVAAAGALAAACGEPPKVAPTNANAAKPANGNDAVKIEPKILRDEAGPDNSHITVRQLENQVEVSVRKWESGGPIKRVSMRKKNGTTAKLRIVYRNGKIVTVDDREAIDHALDWTSAQIDAVAQKSGTVVEQAPAAGKGGGKEDDEDDE